VLPFAEEKQTLEDDTLSPNNISASATVVKA
jgi:hypothetical protein